MKIMIVSDLASPVWGGAENYVVNLGSRLSELDHEVHWITSKISNTPKYEVLDGINIHRIPILYPNRYFFPGRQSFSITSLLPAMKLAKKMDIVQVNSLVPGLLGWTIAKYSKKPSLFFCHELLGDLWGNIGQNILERHIYPVVERLMAKAPYDWFACPSEYSKLTLIRQGAPKDKITVIQHGVNINQPNSNHKSYREKFNLKNHLTIGYIGRLKIHKTGQSKNTQTLLKSIKIVSHELPNVKLLLGGTGFEDLLPLIHDLGIQENVIYLGKVPHEETQNFHRACDVIVCPALSDGFCFLLADASATGIPTVATNLGSHPERIIHNKTGLLSYPTAEALAENMIKLLTDKEMHKEFGNNSKEFVKDLTWDRSVRSHLEIYTRLIQQYVK